METTFDDARQPSVQPESIQPEPAFGGFWIRFWAYLVDLAVIAGINAILIKPIFILTGADGGTSFFSPKPLLQLMVYFLYFVLMTKFLNQTLGKMIFGIRVISFKEEKPLTWGTVLFREVVGRFISKTIWIGYAVAGFTQKKQALHDLFADTAVIHENLFKKN
ncbi:RDD family protein [Bacillus sp. FJAT-42376]|uniref:RDD family protein n=1 Tax=Bacillus sp. FJAT-42376 TaxID=2014076 RepID=UPI000F4D8470|nr:RDD family protein [Bacillus sp. FJAT-42376]AZB43937.1 RDD family protein [Bacillus sp. FJAT-42376]